MGSLTALDPDLLHVAVTAKRPNARREAALAVGGVAVTVSYREP